ncbi:uncharacterized protein [Procambarus clarkii]|uniref:uncharacterized protein n=1 Tax=Procambarus clarkii TaxID=6728 RepID=UPI00374226AB
MSTGPVKYLPLKLQDKTELRQRVIWASNSTGKASADLLLCYVIETKIRMIIWWLALLSNNQVQTLSQMGGASCGDTVRRMMRRIGTYGVWSQYSLVGRKRKRVFKTLDICNVKILDICNVIIKACINTHTNATERDVETSIADMLKNAPNKLGGNR